ncbi:sucrose-phosphatase 2-like isoform X2 [Tripterygium wilfordii]|uniref:Sucrose-phosphatase 2-like isoform X2 n=1 Tax=Tripterygium wilfordii TaxID=458696 RepID=A0A7J7C0W0_TRIWF|nr:sucrose-phosphatase 2-like isoform X2 [Tripterygium wilfordii]
MVGSSSSAQISSDTWLVKFDKRESSGKERHCCLIMVLLSSKGKVPDAFTLVAYASGVVGWFRTKGPNNLVIVAFEGRLRELFSYRKQPIRVPIIFRFLNVMDLSLKKHSCNVIALYVHFNLFILHDICRGRRIHHRSTLIHEVLATVDRVQAPATGFAAAANACLHQQHMPLNPTLVGVPRSNPEFLSKTKVDYVLGLTK